MNNEHQSAHPSQIASPGKGHQGYGRHMVDEHFPKVFPFHVKELWDA